MLSRQRKPFSTTSSQPQPQTTTPLAATEGQATVPPQQPTTTTTTMAADVAQVAEQQPQQQQKHIPHHKVDLNDPNLFIDPRAGRFRRAIGNALFGTTLFAVAVGGTALCIDDYTQELLADMTSTRRFNRHFLPNLCSAQNPPFTLETLPKFDRDEAVATLPLFTPNPANPQQLNMSANEHDVRVKKHTATLQQLYINHELLNAAVSTVDYCNQLSAVLDIVPQFHKVEVWNPVSEQIEIAYLKEELHNAVQELEEFITGWGPQAGLALHWCAKPYEDWEGEMAGQVGKDHLPISHLFNYRKAILNTIFPGYGRGGRSDYILSTNPHMAESDVLENSMLSAFVSANVSLKGALKRLQHFVLYTQTVVNEESYEELLSDLPDSLTPAQREFWGPRRVIPQFNHLYAHINDLTDGDEGSVDNKHNVSDKNVIEFMEFTGTQYKSLFTTLFQTTPGFVTPLTRPKAHLVEEDNVVTLLHNKNKHIKNNYRLPRDIIVNQLALKYRAHNGALIDSYANNQFVVPNDADQMIADQGQPIVKYLTSQISLAKRSNAPSPNELYLQLPVLHRNELDTLKPPYSPTQVISVDCLKKSNTSSSSSSPEQTTDAESKPRSLLSTLRPPQTCDPYQFTPYQRGPLAMAAYQLQEEQHAAPRTGIVDEAFGFMGISAVNYHRIENSFKPGVFPLSFMFYQFGPGKNKFQTRILLPPKDDDDGEDNNNNQKKNGDEFMPPIFTVGDIDAAQAQQELRDMKL